MERREYKLPEVLKNLLEKHNMTQTDLANKLVVGNDTINRWIMNKNMPQLVLVIELSNLFGISIDELVYGEAGGRWSD